MTLGDEIFAHGLLEVGMFQTGEVRRSFRLHLDLLPAYPSLLAVCAHQIAEQLQPVNRIVCPSDSVPLGVAVSLQTKIPLVYSRGRGEAPVRDWVGAYDTGHPIAIICNLLPDAETFVLWRKQLASVGLDVVQVIALLALQPLTVDVPVHALINLREWLNSSPEKLPEGAIQTMLKELNL